MKLYLYGHDYKYAVEQMLLTLYPDERPSYPEGEPYGDRAELRLHEGRERTTATCRLVIGGKESHGRSSFKNDLAQDGVSRDSHCSRIIKNAFYAAALKSGHEAPPWGSLTGVRPGKLFCSIAASGGEKAAVHSFIRDYGVSPDRTELCRKTSAVTEEVRASLGENDVCLYVGIPFCPTRCNYCSFVSQSVEKSMKLIPPFLDALMLEIEALARTVNTSGRRIISIYMGGGTPTTLSASQLDRLCSELERRFDLSNLREYTVEAGRPDTITEEKLRVLRAHGVDRVSVNPQTMCDGVLEAIGRRHSAKDVCDALEKVRTVGGMAVNMDLIAGLSTDTVQGFEDSLRKVLSLDPENVTVHTLSLKNGSRISLEGSRLPTGAEVGEMLAIASRLLPEAGYAPYYLYRQKFMSGGFENLGWTKAGNVNLYNVCIMEELCPILALGGGGSTKLTRTDGGRSERIFAPKYPSEYISGIEKVCADKGKISDFFNGHQED